jgi:DNA-binding NarL/FixJ family response regulator
MSDTKYIAIVDDHSLFRKGLAALIEYFPGYKVLFEAANGKEFIHLLQIDRLPDIVLLDISMPEMDGYSTAEWLRVHHPSVKVLALSTMDSDTAIIKMIKHGSRGYILKDAEPSELQRAFDEVLSTGYFFNELITRKVMGSIHSLVEDSEIRIFLKLSEREVDFLKRACSEKSYSEIADEMCVSPRTVEGYRNSLCEKLNLKTRTGLAIYAIKNGIVKIG